MDLKGRGGYCARFERMLKVFGNDLDSRSWRCMGLRGRKIGFDRREVYRYIFALRF